MNGAPRAAVGEGALAECVPTEQCWEGCEGDRCSLWRLCMWVTLLRKKENENKTNSFLVALIWPSIGCPRHNFLRNRMFIIQINYRKTQFPFTIIKADSPFILSVCNCGTLFILLNYVKHFNVTWYQRTPTSLFYNLLLINSIVGCFIIWTCE